MKKIINGKKYDTETAKLIGTGSSDFYCTNFCYWSEELYIKKTGEYFIYGEGGATSKYGKLIGTNCYSGGKDITPVTKEEAMEWAEKYLSVEEYEEAFGEVEE